MLFLRCPFTKNVFTYKDENEVPEGLIFERVTPYRLRSGNTESTVYCASPKEALTIGIASATPDSHMSVATA